MLRGFSSHSCASQGIYIISIFFGDSDFFFSDVKMTLLYEMIVLGGKFLCTFVSDSLVGLNVLK